MTLLRQTIEGAVKRFNECLPYRAWDYLVYNCFQSTSEVPGNRDDKCARLSARIEVIVWLFQVQSMKYWAGTSDKGTEHVTYRKGISDKVRHELAMGCFADYYWDLVDGGGRLPNLPEDSERVKSSFSDILGVLKDALQEAHGNVLGATQVDAKRQPSFCSKLLHWTFRETFPMIDSNVMAAIDKMCELVGMNPLPNDCKSDAAKAYLHLVDFCKRVEESRELGRMYLVDLDHKKQPVDLLRVPNSWLRVVDKWLWLEGRRIKSNVIHTKQSTDTVSS